MCFSYKTLAILFALMDFMVIQQQKNVKSARASASLVQTQPTAPFVKSTSSSLLTNALQPVIL